MYVQFIQLCTSLPMYNYVQFNIIKQLNTLWFSTAKQITAFFAINNNTKILLTLLRDYFLRQTIFHFR